MDFCNFNFLLLLNIENREKKRISNEEFDTDIYLDYYRGFGHEDNDNEGDMTNHQGEK